jgi:hypothetical protein
MLSAVPCISGDSASAGRLCVSLWGICVPPHLPRPACTAISTAAVAADALQGSAVGMFWCCLSRTCTGTNSSRQGWLEGSRHTMHAHT